MNIVLQEHFFRALNEDYYDSEDIIAKAKQIGAFTELLDSLKAYLEYDDKNKCWVYLRGDVSGRDFYTGVPIQYITDDEKSNLAEDVIEDGVLEYYDWDGLDVDEVKEIMYEDDSLIDSLISALDDEDTANLDEHLIEDDCNSIGKSYIKNKKRLKESMKEIDRKYFTSLNKEGDGHYYILKDGNYVKDFYADSDTDAKKKFQQYLKKNESLKGSLTEAHWNYTLKCGTDLRKAIEDGNAEEVINQLWNGYKELLKADIIDDRDYESYTEDLIDSEYWEKDELEDNIDWALDNFYDLCDNARVWISLNEHFVTTPEYNGACADIYRQMVDGKISKEEAEEGFRQMDTLLDESHPVTESLWDIVKGYLEEGLNEDLNGSCPFKLTDLVKQVYMNCYDDELGEEIDPNITFQSIYDTLNAHEDVYDCLGVGDSIIRERVFEILADILGVEYDDIYLVWIDKRQSIRLSPKGDGLTESMWEPADKQELERLRQDIKKTKSKLLSQIKRKHGVWENFGQKELRALEDKYPKLYFTPEYNTLIDEFRNWCYEQY